MPFPRVLVLCEMQTVTSRIWTRVSVSISYDDNHYTTGTSSLLYQFFWNTIYIEFIYFEWIKSYNFVCIFISASHQTGFDLNSFYNGDLAERGVVIGSLGAMWTMKAFAKSPDTKPNDLAGYSFNLTRSSRATLVNNSSHTRRLPNRSRGPFSLESIIVFDIPYGINAKPPSQLKSQRGMNINILNTWGILLLHDIPQVENLFFII